MTSTAGTTFGTASIRTAPWTFMVSVRLDRAGPEAAREVVTAADLTDARAEAWLNMVLRAGRLDVCIEDLSFVMTPRFKEGDSSRCEGFALEADDSDGEAKRCAFSIRALEHVAGRAAERLIAGGTLKAGDVYYYEVVANRASTPASVPMGAPQPEGEGFTLTVKRTGPTYLTVPLKRLIERSEPVGAIDEKLFPVFYTAEAMRQAERFSRAGAESQPPVETGGVLIGVLCSCPDTQELFAVVCEVLEVLDAEQKEFSLSYSGRSWQRIQTVMKARKQNPATRAQLVLGQAHGHNFLPGHGVASCELCPKVKTCLSTTVFVSGDDRLWSRAVFAKQPWVLAHIFGLNARGERIHGLFGLKDARLQERGFYLLADDFNFTVSTET